jgi:hypothetical protein
MKSQGLDWCHVFFNENFTFLSLSGCGYFWCSMDEPRIQTWSPESCPVAHHCRVKLRFGISMFLPRRWKSTLIKFFWLRGHWPRQIHQALFATLGSDADSEDSVGRFESGNTSCEDISRAGRLLTDLAEPFRLFLQDYLLTSARILSRHFSAYATTVKEILAAILVWENSLDDECLIHCAARKKWGEPRDKLSC